MYRRIIRDVTIVLLITIPFGFYFSHQTNKQKKYLSLVDNRMQSIDAVLERFQSEQPISKAELQAFTVAYTASSPKGKPPKLPSIATLPEDMQPIKSEQRSEIRIELLEEKVKNIENKITVMEDSQWSPWVVAVLIPILLIVINPFLNEIGILLKNMILRKKDE